MKTAALKHTQFFVWLVVAAVFSVPAFSFAATLGTYSVDANGTIHFIGVTSSTMMMSSSAELILYKGTYPDTSTMVSSAGSGTASPRVFCDYLLYGTYDGSGNCTLGLDSSQGGEFGGTTDGNYWVDITNVSGINGGAETYYAPLVRASAVWSAPPPPIDWSAITFPTVYSTTSPAIAASSSLWANLDLASTTLQCATGNIFTDGLCTAFSFLFVPDPNTLNNYTTFTAMLETKFPFSWMYQVQTAITGLTASSTSNFQTASLNLASLGVGSTTAIGNILPDVDVLSTTTIEKFMPSGMWSSIQALIAAALWLSLGLYIFYEVRGLLHRV